MTISQRKIVKYRHHGNEVSVDEELKGQHRKHCLCWQGCIHFQPELPLIHCPIASALYQFDIDHGLVTPVYECPKYEPVTGA